MDPTYFTTPTTGFGPAEWVFFIASIAVALGGIYLAFLLADSNAVRLQALRQIGYAMSAGGVLGVIVGGVKLSGLALAPLWLTIVTVLLVVVAGYALYVMLAVLPQRLAAQVQSRPRNAPRSPTAQRAAATPRTPNVASSNGAERPAVLGNRRESRRDRKRRGK
jgi:hypothetical protein